MNVRVENEDKHGRINVRDEKLLRCGKCLDENGGMHVRDENIRWCG